MTNGINDLTHPQKQNARVSNYKLSFPEIPSLVYWCKGAEIPGISLPAAKIPTPYTDISNPGNKIEYEDLTIEFSIDEDISNWDEIHNWMRGLASVEYYGDSTTLVDNLLGAGKKTTDITILITNNMGVGIAEIVFKNAWPTNLSSMQMRSDNNDTEFLTASASFQYDYYTFTRI